MRLSEDIILAVVIENSLIAERFRHIFRFKWEFVKE